MKPEPPTSAVVELGEQEEVMKSRPYLCTGYFAYREEESAFAASPYLFCDIGYVNVTIPRSKVSVSETLLQANRRHCLLTNAAGLQLLIEPESKEDVLEMTNTAAMSDLSEEPKRAIKTSCKKINYV